MPGYGMHTLGKTGQQIMALFVLEGAEWKPGGITVDWSKVAAVAVETTLPDGTIVPVGGKYLRYGQVMTEIDTPEIQTVEWTGGPTAGAGILSLPEFGDYDATPLAGIAYNATAAQFEDALNDLPQIGPGGASVSRAGAGSAGSPYIYTITYARRLGNVPQLTNVSNTFTGGTAPSSTIGTTTAGTGQGYFGPYDPAATDGRQTLSRGQAYILNETVLENVPFGWGQPNSDHPAVFEGGLVWKARILATVGTASLEDGPTFTNLETVFPELKYAQ